MSTPTYNEIANDFELWGEYVDTAATMTEEEFEAMPTEEKIALIKACFGPE